MSQRKPLTATKLRVILTVSLFVILIGAGALFYFANSKLLSYAESVSATNAQASASDNNLQTLQNIQDKLESKKDAVTRAAEIVAESQSYQYQNQIIKDINDYAKRANIQITNMSFTSTDSSATNKAAPSGPGVKSTFASITLQNPVDYNNLLHFLHSIEQNLTKMQITNVSISKESGSDQVSSQALTIEVYIR